MQPLTLLDLDDTIFQTAKHLPIELLRHVATVDQAGQPLSWMTDQQQQFWQWLSQSTEIVPVTARSVAGLARVQLPFSSWTVCQHGAVILTPDRQFEPVWWAQMQQDLQPFAELLQIIEEHVQTANIDGVRTWIAQEQDTAIYLVVKQSTQPYFAELIDWVEQRWPDQFYVHINGRTMALLPHVVSKRRAVEYLLPQINPTQRAVLGWGDSLSDLGFLQHCDWWGVPKRSQAGAWVREQLAQQIESRGVYEFEGR